MPDTSTIILIEAAPADPDAITVSSGALAEAIRQRHRYGRITALQRVVDEYPAAYEQYGAALGIDPPGVHLHEVLS